MVVSSLFRGLNGCPARFAVDGGGMVSIAELSQDRTGQELALSISAQYYPGDMSTDGVDGVVPVAV